MSVHSAAQQRAAQPAGTAQLFQRQLMHLNVTTIFADPRPSRLVSAARLV